MTRKPRTLKQSGGRRQNNQAPRRPDTQPVQGHVQDHDQETTDLNLQNTPDRKAQVWQVVAMIPKGKVASYGQIAALIGLPSHARFVGATLRNLPGQSKLPWHRVVNSSMRISPRDGGEARQKDLLLAEGVTFVGARIAADHRWEASAH